MSRSLLVPVLCGLLTLAAVDVYAQTLTVGQTYNGELRTSDAMLDDGQYVNCIDLDLPTDREVVVTLRSRSFDAVLLAGSGRCTGDGDLDLYLINDDFEDGSTDSQIRFMPTARHYVAGITSYHAGQTGEYSLAVEESGAGTSGKPAQGGGSSIVTATLGVAQSYSGVLRSTDLTIESGESAGLHYQCFDMHLPINREVAITLRSSDFDAYLMAGPGSCDGDFELIFENNDFESTSTDAQINLLTTQQRYITVITSDLAGETGNFTLDAGVSNVIALTFNGTITQQSPVLEDYYYECHSIPLVPGSDVLVAVNSPDFLPLLIVSPGTCENPDVDNPYAQEGYRAESGGGSVLTFTSSAPQYSIFIVSAEADRVGRYSALLGF